MENKKVYIVVTPFFPSPSSWRGAYVLDQVKAIQRNSDYKVLVFRPGQGDDYEIDGIKVHTFKTLETPSYLFNGVFNSLNSRRFLSKLHATKIDIARISFVHCHTGMFGAYGLALKKINPSIKVLLQHHNLDVFTVMNGKFADWKINNHYRARKAIKIFNQVDAHVCISQPVMDSLLAFPQARDHEVFEPYIERMKQLHDMQSVKPKKCILLPNGVDTQLFHPSADKGNKGIFRIGCIANFQTLKDHITLIKAFEVLKQKGYSNVVLSLLGSGPTKQSCIDYINERNLQGYVEWPKEVSHEQLPDYYRILDLFVLPSIFEGFGCVYNEAFACGVPFICCKYQGIADCIEESDRWTIDYHNHVQLASLIGAYIDNRYKQNLTCKIDIDGLILDYLNEIKQI